MTNRHLWALISLSWFVAAASAANPPPPTADATASATASAADRIDIDGDDTKVEAFAIHNPPGGMCGSQAWGTAGGVGAGIGTNSPICELEVAYNIAIGACHDLQRHQKDQACHDAAELQRKLKDLALARALPTWAEKAKRWIPAAFIFWR